MAWIPALLLLSCGGVAGRLFTPACPVLERSAEAEHSDLRARIRLTSSGREIFLEAIGRSSPAELVVAGISGFGTRLFSAVQRGPVIEVEDATRELEHVARSAMDALHRTAWTHAPADLDNAPVLSWRQGSETVTQWIEAGKRRREFSRIGEREVVSVQENERVVEVRNPWCGYEAVIALLDHDGSRLR